MDLWVVDRISIMYVAGGVDLWTCRPMGCGQLMYLAIGVQRSRSADLR